MIFGRPSRDPSCWKAVFAAQIEEMLRRVVLAVGAELPVVFPRHAETTSREMEASAMPTAGVTHYKPLRRWGLDYVLKR